MSLVLFLLTAVGIGFLTFLYASGVDYTFLIILAILFTVIPYFFSDKLVLASMRAKVVSPEEAPDLHAMIERLSQMAGIPKPKIAVSDMALPNAFATGRSPSHAVVCVTTGLLRRLTTPELEGVLAHEISHIVNRDMTVITIAQFIPMIASYLMNSLMWMGLFGGGRDRDDRGGNSFIFVYLATILVYWLSTLLVMALSRYREYSADRTGAIITGAPSQLATALMKISGIIQVIPEQDLRQVQHANAFFLIPAAKGSALMEIFSTHPSTEKRVARLQRLQQQIETGVL
jgi:heat shock protein HtpX